MVVRNTTSFYSSSSFRVSFELGCTLGRAPFANRVEIKIELAEKFIVDRWINWNFPWIVSLRGIFSPVSTWRSALGKHSRKAGCLAIFDGAGPRGESHSKHETDVRVVALEELLLPRFAALPLCSRPGMFRFRNLRVIPTIHPHENALMCRPPPDKRRVTGTASIWHANLTTSPGRERVFHPGKRERHPRAPEALWSSV